MTNISVALIGNCQARPLADILPKINANIKITSLFIVHLMKTEDYPLLISQLKAADIIITQLISDNYPISFIATNYLKSLFPEKVFCIVNLYYSGYNPEAMYIKNGKKVLSGPLGDYHIKHIRESWLSNQSLKDCSALCHDTESLGIKYAGIHDSSLSNLLDREINTDVNIVDYIENNLFLTHLFWTMNHPSNSLLIEYAKRIINAASLDAGSNSNIPAIKNEFLNQIELPVNPYAKKELGIKFDGPEIYKGKKMEVQDGEMIFLPATQYYTVDEVCEIFYRLYDQTE